MTAIDTRRLLHWGGSALGLAGVVFVGVKIAEYGDQLAITHLDHWTWGVIGLLAVSYGFANLLLANAWRHLLDHLGAPVTRRWACWAYGISQLAKYIPGNIIHLAGRHAIALGSGIPTWPSLKSTVWELAAIAGTACLFVLLLMPLLWPAASSWGAIGLFLASLGLAASLVGRIWGAALVAVVICHALFLALSGLIFVAVLALTALSSSGLLSLIVPLTGVYVFAWLAGLVTPGAPAGLGVREAILYGLVPAATVSRSDLLLAILVGRLITISGDLIYYAYAQFALHPSRATPVRWR